MNLFDSEIKEINKLIDSQDKVELPLTDNLIEDLGKNNMIFANEAAYELGSDNDSVSFDLATSNRDLINSDQIILIGKDLKDIKENSKFSRITIVGVNDDEIKGDELYDRLEKIKFTKYRVSPKGYMLRTASGNKERVRVSKDLVKNHDFSKIGSAYIKAYKQVPFVKNVIIIFITGENNIYTSLKEIGIKKTNITEAIDHILKGMVANDCGSCSVKDLCDEVEGMREIHKGN